jgi:hypothetical protein
MGNFAFPKRERFNEEIDEEIQSQKSNRVHSQMLSSKSLIVKGDNTSNRSMMSQKYSVASSKKDLQAVS